MLPVEVLQTQADHFSGVRQAIDGQEHQDVAVADVGHAFRFGGAEQQPHLIPRRAPGQRFQGKETWRFHPPARPWRHQPRPWA